MSTPIPGLAQAQDERALRFQQSHARALRALAYRMLGSRAEAALEAARRGIVPIDS